MVSGPVGRGFLSLIQSRRRGAHPRPANYHSDCGQGHRESTAVHRDMQILKETPDCRVARIHHLCVHTTSRNRDQGQG